MKITQILIGLCAASYQMINGQQCKEISAVQKIMPQSSCVSLQVASGTGCAWMCDYCANQLMILVALQYLKILQESCAKKINIIIFSGMMMHL